MAFGGGSFTSQNKVLPGSYINFVSATSSSALLSERGYVAVPMELDWCVDETVFSVTTENFESECLAAFGYDYTHEKVKALRELFRNAKTAYIYKLNKGTKASNTFATAKYSGTRGNDIKIVISANVDDNTKFDVATILDTTKVDEQTVSSAKALISNEYVNFIADATLALTAGTPLAGGTNGSAVTGTEYQTFLNKIESYSFNVLACPSTTAEIISLFVAFTKRMRDEVGIKFQTVVYRTVADYEGVINLQNTVTDSGANAASLVYWVAGKQAGCEINKSVTNKTYNGEFTVNTDYTQSELEAAIKAGKFIFHKVGDEVRTLDDINSFTSVTADKTSDFSSNQTIRVLDQIGNDIAVIFNNKYLGAVQNNAAGRIAFWNEIVDYCKELETVEAIEDFESSNVTVSKGNNKNSVVVSCTITPVNAMRTLYMSVIVE